MLHRSEAVQNPFVAGMKQLGDGPFHRIPQQHHHAGLGEEVVDATRHIGVEQIKGRDLSAALIRWGV